MISTDHSIESRVQQSLARIGCNNIDSIRVADGHVTLIGKIDSQDERALAIAVARTVPGVVAVTSERG